MKSQRSNKARTAQKRPLSSKVAMVGKQAQFHGKKPKPILIRLPEDLYKFLVDQSHAKKCSLNAYLLEVITHHRTAKRKSK